MTRNTLPSRRRQETFDLDHNGQCYSVSIGLHDGGQLGEVFVQAHKRASDIEAAARDAAILVSLAIQHGVPLAQLRDATTRDGQGEPASVIGAVLDAIGSYARA